MKSPTSNLSRWMCDLSLSRPVPYDKTVMQCIHTTYHKEMYDSFFGGRDRRPNIYFDTQNFGVWYRVG